MRSSESVPELLLLAAVLVAGCAAERPRSVDDDEADAAPVDARAMPADGPDAQPFDAVADMAGTLPDVALDAAPPDALHAPVPEPALVCREVFDEALIAATIVDPSNYPSPLVPPDRWLPAFDRRGPHYPCLDTPEAVVVLWEARGWATPRVRDVAPQWFDVRMPHEEARPGDGDMVAKCAFFEDWYFLDFDGYRGQGFAAFGPFPGNDFSAIEYPTAHRLAKIRPGIEPALVIDAMREAASDFTKETMVPRWEEVGSSAGHRIRVCQVACFFNDWCLYPLMTDREHEQSDVIEAFQVDWVYDADAREITMHFERFFTKFMHFRAKPGDEVWTVVPPPDPGPP